MRATLLFVLLLAGMAMATTSFSYNLTSQADGCYPFVAHANHSTTGTWSSDSVNSTVCVDTIPPSFDNLANTTMDDGDDYLYVQNCTDLGVGIATIAINDTTNFAISLNGSANDTYRSATISNKTGLAMGVYALNITITDGVDHTTTNITYITVLDSTPPFVTADPDDGFLTNLNQFLFNFTTTDGSPPMSCNLTINGTNYGSNASVANNTFTSIQNSPAFTNDGRYWWNVSCTDTAGLQGNSTTRYFDLDATAPTLTSASVNDTSPRIYPNGTYLYINITVSDDFLNATLLEWNGVNETLTNNISNVYYITKGPLSAGTHNWTFHANDTQDQWGHSAAQNFTITKATPTFTFWINDTDGNFELQTETSDEVYFNATIDELSPIINIHRNGIFYVNGTSPFSNTTNVTGWATAVWTMVANWTGNENYTAASSEHDLILKTITKNLYLNGFLRDINVTQGDTVNITCAFVDTGYPVNISANDTLLSNNLTTAEFDWDTSESPGVWNITCNFTGLGNYSDWQRVRQLRVIPADLNITYGGNATRDDWLFPNRSVEKWPARWQTDTIPHHYWHNNETSELSVNLTLSADPAACMEIFAGNSSNSSLATNLTTTQWAILPTLPAGGLQSVWMWATLTNCTGGQVLFLPYIDVYYYAKGAD